MRSFGMARISVTVLVFTFAFGTLSAAPAPQDDGEKSAEGPVLGVRRPFDLGINIPRIFDMKLLTGRGGTDLGINIPEIFNLQLDRNRGGARGLLLDFFGASGRPRGRSIFRPSENENLVPGEAA
ncbi:uncharacterized protein LOC144179245 [Haemaphysalis longicornis]